MNISPYFFSLLIKNNTKQKIVVFVEPFLFCLLFGYVGTSNYIGVHKQSASIEQLLKEKLLKNQDELNGENSQELGKIEFYHRRHYSTDKGWISPFAEQNYDEMLKLKDQPPPEGSAPLTEDEICEMVLGKRRNYVCGLGNGFIRRSTTPAYEPEIEEYRRRAETAETAERRSEKLSAQLAEQGTQLQGLQVWQAKIDAYIQLQSGVGSPFMSHSTGESS